MTTPEPKRCRLVVGETLKGTVEQRIAVLQLAIAAELARNEVDVVEEDAAVTDLPRPTLILSDGRTIISPISGVCALLSADPFSAADGVGAISHLVQDVLADNPISPSSSIIAQLTVFSAVHVMGLEDSLKGRIHPSAAVMASEFSKRPEVWQALNRLPLSGQREQRVREGLAWEYDWSEKRLPKAGERNILITAALPYVNNAPHLGNIIGCLLSADVYARFCRARGYNTIYVSGTDEYGTTTETKALEEGLSCEEICAKYFRVHAGVYDWFQIKCDIFGRTSTPQQTAITHSIFRSLYDRGYFIEQSVEQCYCEKCKRFLADRYIEGTCPLCGFHDARGDQCDKCGKLINPMELIASKCKMCRSSPTVRSSRHLFLDLTKLQPDCEAFVDASSVKGKWSSNSAAIAKGWLHEGLKPRCMTRDLKWGTSVPVEGFEDKVFYVWFDAPIGYLSITANYTDQWELWWKNPNDVQLYQFMGKDNVPFHTVIFPSTLIGTGHPFTLLHHISTTEYLNYESGKFSKSRGTGVFGNDARDSGIPACVWRYYLLATRPETNDAIFDWDDFSAKVNTELLANLGNFVNRTCKFLSAKMDSRLGDVHLIDQDQLFITKVNELLHEYIESMEGVKLKAGLRAAMAISAAGNGYLQDCKLDNKLLLSDPSRCANIINVAVNVVYLLSALLQPFLPSSSDDILSILNAPARTIPSEFTLDLLPGHMIGTPFLLFHRLEEPVVRELRARFAGKQ